MQDLRSLFLVQSSSNTLSNYRLQTRSHMGINVLLCLHVGWRAYDAFKREGQKNDRMTTLKEILKETMHQQLRLL